MLKEPKRIIAEEPFEIINSCIQMKIINLKCFEDFLYDLADYTLQSAFLHQMIYCPVMSSTATKTSE